MLKFVFPEDFPASQQVFIEDECGARICISAVHAIRTEPAEERGLAVGNLGDIVYEEVRAGSKTVRFAGGEITLQDPRRSGNHIHKR